MFSMKTSKVRVAFHVNGEQKCFLAFSSGNGNPWLALYSQNNVNNGLQKLGPVSVEKDRDDALIITAAQWSIITIIPLNGTVELTEV